MTRHQGVAQQCIATCNLHSESLCWQCCLHVREGKTEARDTVQGYLINSGKVMALIQRLGFKAYVLW